MYSIMAGNGWVSAHSGIHMRAANWAPSRMGIKIFSITLTRLGKESIVLIASSFLPPCQFPAVFHSSGLNDKEKHSTHRLSQPGSQAGYFQAKQLGLRRAKLEALARGQHWPRAPPPAE